MKKFREFVAESTTKKGRKVGDKVVLYHPFTPDKTHSGTISKVSAGRFHVKWDDKDITSVHNDRNGHGVKDNFIAEAEFIIESETSISEHDQAHKIVKKHATDVDYATGDHEEDSDHVHIGAVHPSKVSSLHNKLQAAGFKKSSKTKPAFYGAHSRDQDDYHHFKKGKTHVLVSTSPNTYGKNQEVFDHHHVEIHTNKPGI